MNPSPFHLNLALVIGINDYGGGISPLGTARQDAEAIAAILEQDYNYQVRLLMEGQATGAADIFPPGQGGQPAGDGVITATELYLYLRDAVEIPTDQRRLRQTPQIWSLKKHDKGEFIFLPPQQAPNLPPAPPLEEGDGTNPYRGLRAYEPEDSALFFGRTALIQKLKDAVARQPLTVVLGASGSGKSSLVKAGLIPQLQAPGEDGGAPWLILDPLRPGASPPPAVRGNPGAGFNSGIRPSTPDFTGDRSTGGTHYPRAGRGGARGVPPAPSRPAPTAGLGSADRGHPALGF